MVYELDFKWVYKHQWPWMLKNKPEEYWNYSNKRFMQRLKGEMK